MADQSHFDPLSLPNPDAADVDPRDVAEHRATMRDDESLPVRRGVVAVIVNDDRLLVIRRSQQVVAPGAFCFPGGAIESGESEPAALVREIEEELGVCVRPLRPLWQSVTPWNVHLTWWLADAPSPDCVWMPNAAEVESIHWLTPAEIQSLPALLESNHQFLRALAAGEVLLEWR